MQNAERIRRFTHGVAMMKDPPWLPTAAWFAVVPMLHTIGVIAVSWTAFSFILAVVATTLASRRFKHAYGVVTASRDTYSRLAGAGSALGIAVIVIGLQVLAFLVRWPVELGLAAFGAWLALGARASKGLRPHLYVLAAICIGVAFVPLLAGITGQRSLLESTGGGGMIYVSAFGVGWVYVCIQDYRVIRRNLRLAQG